MTLAMEPKRPVGGAFGVFLEMHRARIRGSMPADCRMPDIVKEASAEFRALCEEDRKPYERLARKRAEAYKEALHAFEAQGGIRARVATAAKKTRDPKCPKRLAGGAYGVFLEENRAVIRESLPVGHKVTEIAKAASALWRALPKDAKMPYEDKYQKKFAAYQTALAAYRRSLQSSHEGENQDGNHEAVQAGLSTEVAAAEAMAETMAKAAAPLSPCTTTQPDSPEMKVDGEQRLDSQKALLVELGGAAESPHGIGISSDIELLSPRPRPSKRRRTVASPPGLDRLGGGSLAASFAKREEAFESPLGTGHRPHEIASDVAHPGSTQNGSPEEGSLEEWLVVDRQDARFTSPRAVTRVRNSAQAHVSEPPRLEDDPRLALVAACQLALLGA